MGDKVQRLFVEVSSSISPDPAEASMRPAVGPPSRPPRPSPAVMPVYVMPGYGCTVPATPLATPDGMTSFPPQNELADEDLSRLKLRVQQLELDLQQRAEGCPGDSATCSQEVDALKVQLEDTRAQLAEAKDEIQQAKAQIQLLSQRLDGMQMQSARGDSATPLDGMTPRVVPAAVAGHTP